MKKTLFGLVVALCLVGVSSVQAADYDHEMEGGGVTFSWKVDGDTLHGKMSAKTKGWVAVGFNPVEKMQGGNYILGFVKGDEPFGQLVLRQNLALNPDGRIALRGYRSSGHRSPPIPFLWPGTQSSR